MTSKFLRGVGVSIVALFISVPASAASLLKFELLGSGSYQVPIYPTCGTSDPLCGKLLLDGELPQTEIFARLTNIGDEQFIGMGAGLSYNSSGTNLSGSTYGERRSFFMGSDNNVPSMQSLFELDVGKSVDFVLFHAIGVIGNPTLLPDGSWMDYYYPAQNGETETFHSIALQFIPGSDPESWNSYNPSYVYLDSSITLTAAAPSPVPLPAALPLMLSGFGVLGFAARRRKMTA